MYKMILLKRLIHYFFIRNRFRNTLKQKPINDRPCLINILGFV